VKVLLVSTLYPPYVIGGAEKAAALLAEALVRRGNEVVVVSLHPESEEIVEKRNGVLVYRLPMDNVYWPFGRKEKPNTLLRLVWHIREIWNPVAARRIGRILDMELPDIVHTHNICGFSLAAWREIKRRKIRLVHTLHDYYLLCTRSSLFRNGRNCTDRCLDCRVLTVNRKQMSRLPDSVVSVSRHTLDEHLKRGCFEGVPTTVIHNIYSDGSAPLRQASSREGDSADVVFGFIGKIEEQKGLETLLSASTQLQRSNWKLKIAGTGLENYVKELSEKYADTRIEWLGFTDSSAFYAQVDAVVIPSLWADPLPYVCVESLHAGKRLICAASGGIPEMARLSPRAEIFPAGDSVALAEKMNLLLADPRLSRSSEGGGDSDLSIFNEEFVMGRYLQQYFPAIPERPDRRPSKG
jgi:glycosyltransferase involved in cell wall biosynthesis